MKDFCLSSKIDGPFKDNQEGGWCSLLKVKDVKEFVRLLKELDDLYENNKITWEGYLIRKKALAGEALI